VTPAICPRTRWDALSEVRPTWFEHWVEQQGYEGEYVFSSDEAMRVVAIVAKEREINDLSIALNSLMMPPAAAGGGVGVPGCGR